MVATLTPNTPEHMARVMAALRTANVARAGLTTAQARGALDAAGLTAPTGDDDLPMKWSRDARKPSGGSWVPRSVQRANRARTRRADQADRRMLVSLANRHGCLRCGEKTGLHRHHISPADKRFEISDAVASIGVRCVDRRRYVSFDEFYAELMYETIALCGPCHDAEHDRRPREASA